MFNITCNTKHLHKSLTIKNLLHTYKNQIPVKHSKRFMLIVISIFLRHLFIVDGLQYKKKLIT